MDFQFLFNIVMGVAAAMGGWIVGRITKSLDRLDEDVRTMPEKYVSKEDYRSDIRDIKEMLTRITERMDSKADKPGARR